MTDGEEALSTWGSGSHPSNAARQDDLVLKTGGSWSPSVIALLEHFEHVGFEGAPRVAGSGTTPDGRMALRYVPGTREMHGLPETATRARHARSIVDAYGLDTNQREVVVERMIEVALAGVRADAIANEITPGSCNAVTAAGYPVLWSITWRARSAGWMLRNQHLLARAMSR